MKKRVTKEKLLKEVQRVSRWAKPIQEKIENVLAKNSVYRWASERSVPFKKRALIAFGYGLEKIRSISEAIREELQGLKQQCKEEPRKTVFVAAYKVKHAVKKRQRSQKGERDAKASSGRKNAVEARRTVAAN